MTVLKITANLESDDIATTQRFYAQLFDLDRVMDLGWIATLSAGQDAPVQLNIAREGGSGAPVPHLSIEVDDVNRVHKRAQDMGTIVCYPLTDEPWGIRRFFTKDPDGRILNVLQHTAN